MKVSDLSPLEKAIYYNILSTPGVGQKLAPKIFKNVFDAIDSQLKIGSLSEDGLTYVEKPSWVPDDHLYLYWQTSRQIFWTSQHPPIEHRDGACFNLRIKNVPQETAHYLCSKEASEYFRDVVGVDEETMKDPDGVYMRQFVE